MTEATAEAVASIRFNAPGYTKEPERNAYIIERYIKWFSASSAGIADTIPNTQNYVFTTPKPSWLPATERRIRNSISQLTRSEESNGRWLSQEVVNASTDFFSATADLLPGEPYIYSSSKGDLVAELSTKKGKLTIIISPNFTILFSSIDGTPVRYSTSNLHELRSAVEGITEGLKAQ